MLLPVVGVEDIRLPPGIGTPSPMNDAMSDKGWRFNLKQITLHGMQKSPLLDDWRREAGRSAYTGRFTSSNQSNKRNKSSATVSPDLTKSKRTACR